MSIKVKDIQAKKNQFHLRPFIKNLQLGLFNLCAFGNIYPLFLSRLAFTGKRSKLLSPLMGEGLDKGNLPLIPTLLGNGSLTFSSFIDYEL